MAEPPVTAATPTPLGSLPAVRVMIRAGVVAAGVSALLVAAGFSLADEADVLVVDDSWLDDLPALAEAPAVVSLGAGTWAEVLPELVAGGWAALSADATPQELLGGVLGAAAGLAVLSPEYLQSQREREAIEDDSANPGMDVTLSALTARERDVLAQLAEGLSNKRIARELGVTESTVKFHVQAIYSKLGVQSRAGAVSRGIQLGLISV